MRSAKDYDYSVNLYNDKGVSQPYLSLLIDKRPVNFEYRMSNGYKALDKRIENTVVRETWHMQFSSKLYDHTSYNQRLWC